jgi:TfoX/Sxy family transcriptional regulator of competence genes
VAYDEELADRIRELVGAAAGTTVTEQRMFGGLAFLVGGHMAVAASSRGGLMVRVDPDDTDRLLATTTATPMVMRGREARGWLRVAADDVRTKRQLSRWVTIGTKSAAALPPKAAKRT